MSIQRLEGFDITVKLFRRVQGGLRDLGALAQRSRANSRHEGQPLATRWAPDLERRNFIVDRQDKSAARHAIGSIREALAQLGNEHVLRSQDRESADPHQECQEESERIVWTLGLVVYRLDRRNFLRGQIEFRESQPIDVPESVVQYLVSIPGTRDLLTREIHGHWGYHYHYLDHGARRSDTLLTFDRASKDVAMPTLCWERHGEGGFSAKAARWGTPKRQSVYSVCSPDTRRFALADFKRPGADAQAVWP